MFMNTKRNQYTEIIYRRDTPCVLCGSHKKFELSILKETQLACASLAL